MSPASTRRLPTKEENDEDILDITAGLIARRGIEDAAEQARPLLLDGGWNALGYEGAFSA